MTAPRWTAALLRRVAPADRVEEVLGDLEEAHRRRIERQGRILASLLTGLEAFDMAVALVRARRRRRSAVSFGFSWLDFKLGLRMLVRYPGLTVVGGLAIAFAIWVGAGTFEFVTQVSRPTLPLPEGDRIVGVRLYDSRTRDVELRTAHDFSAWRARASSLQDWGAYRSAQRNLIVGEGPGEPVLLAEMTASGFIVAGVAPLLGRPLTAADEAVGAPDVVVIGYDVWRSRFAGDPAVIGRTVRVGTVPASVVGVMPEGFAFPIAQQLWTPLRLNPLAHDWRQGPGIMVFARLAPGATLARARIEMSELGSRIAAAHPRTHALLRVEVLSYGLAAIHVPPNVGREVATIFLSSNLFLFGLLGLICSNVALLIFARAAARENELVVRNALGASRSRIVAQLFVEALVLGGVGAALGLAGAGYGLRWGLNVLWTQLVHVAPSTPAPPFWIRGYLSPSTVWFAVLLTVVGALIAGVLPAFKVTRGLGARLRQASAGGGGIRFGGVWTAVIVTQVAATVAFPAMSFFTYRDRKQLETAEVEVVTGRYLAVRLEMDAEPPPTAPADTSRAAFVVRYAAAREELDRRLLLDPLVVGVTFAERLPKMAHRWNQIEVDGGAVVPPGQRGHRTAVLSVDPDYFEVLGAPIRAGRAFDAGDLAADARVVVVNQPFVDSVMGGRNPIGRQVRFVMAESSREYRLDGPWHEIVGVVGDLGTTTGYGPEGIYRPHRPGDVYPVHMVVHLRGDALSFAPRLRGAATGVDPTLRLHDVMRLDDTIRDEMRVYDFWLRLTVIVSAVALLLSLAGIYAVMSFTVSRRTREIGVRVALGGSAVRIIPAILARPLAQIALGIVVGIGMVVLLMIGMHVWRLSATQVALIAAYAVLMTGVCTLACIVPTRRALRVEPTEALRADG